MSTEKVINNDPMQKRAGPGAAVTITRPRAKADPDTLHAVYSALFDLLPLSDTHRQHLLGPDRGLTPEQIGRHQYRTMPPSRQRRYYAEPLLDTFSWETLLAVPALFRVQGGNDGNRPDHRPRLSLTGPNGIICPIKDAQGRTISFQVRCDTQSKKGGKYLTASSAKKGGFGPKGGRYPAHVAYPTELRDPRIFITEGIIKANYAADHLGAVVIGLLGVSMTMVSEVEALVREVAPDAPLVVSAYDADLVEKEAVAGENEKLLALLAASQFPVAQADWDIEQGKGIDDLLRDGGTFTVGPFIDRQKGRNIPVSAEAVHAARPAEIAPSTLDTARSEHRQRIAEVLANRGENPAQLFLASDCGTGKTHATMAALEAEYRAGRWDKRRSVLFVVDQRAQLDNLQTEFPWLAGAIESQQIALLVGRDEDNCLRPPSDLALMHRYGAQRQNINAHFCAPCELKSECLYQAERKKARSAPLVLATKAAVFSTPQVLGQFTAIIVDEDLLASCLFDDRTELTPPSIRQWLARMDAINASTFGDKPYPADHPARRWLELLLDCLENAPEAEGDHIEDWPLLPALSRLAGDRETLAALVDASFQSLRYEDQDTSGTFAFEEANDPGAVPLKMAGELLAQMRLELAGDEASPYSRLKYHKDLLRLYLLRDEAIDKLQNTTFVNLDATPPLLLHSLFPNAEQLRHHIPVNLNVTQLRGSLHTRGYLGKAKTVDSLQTILQTIMAAADQPILMTYQNHSPAAGEKAALPIEVDHPNAIYGYFGKHDRAYNDPAMMEADMLVILGTPFANINEMRNLTHALLCGQTAPLPVDCQRKVYDHVDRREVGWARAMRSDPDPHVQAAIDHQVESVIWQTIGRLRAVMRPQERINVCLLTGYPIKGLRVDTLLTMKELREQVGMAASKVDRLNAQRKADAEERIYVAIGELIDEGIAPSQRRVCERAKSRPAAVGRVTREWIDEWRAANTLVSSAWDDDEVRWSDVLAQEKAVRKARERKIEWSDTGTSLKNKSSETSAGITPINPFKPMVGELPNALKINALHHIRGTHMTDIREAVSRLTELQREDFEERAALIQIDGNRTQAEAEQLAFDAVAKPWQKALVGARGPTFCQEWKLNESFWRGVRSELRTPQMS